MDKRWITEQTTGVKTSQKTRETWQLASKESERKPWCMDINEIAKKFLTHNPHATVCVMKLNNS